MSFWNGKYTSSKDRIGNLNLDKKIINTIRSFIAGCIKGGLKSDK